MILRGVVVRWWVLVACAVAGVLSAAGVSSAAEAATAPPSLDPAARITVSPQQADIGTTLEIRGTSMRGCPDGSIDVFLLWHPDGGNMGDYRYLLAAGLPMNDANGYSFTLRHKVTDHEVDSNQVQAVCHAADRKASAGVPVAAPVKMTGRSQTTGRPSPAPVSPPANLPANAATAVPSSGLPGSTFVVWIKASCPRGDDMASLRNSMWAAWDETDLLPDVAPSTASGTDGIDRAIRLQVPVSGTRGPHKITVPCVSGHDTRELTTTFTVTPTELTVTPPNPAPGGRFHATGKYFTGCADAGAGRTGEIALALGSREIGRTQVAPDGSFDADLSLPADATGNDPLTAACTIDHFDGTAQTALTLASAATPVTPHHQGAPLAPGRSASAAQLPQPADAFHHPGTVAAAAVGSTIAIAVVGAGAEIVNRTIEEQRERIRRFFHPGGRAPRRNPRFPGLHVLAFVLLSSLFALVADPGLDFDRGTLTLGLAMVVAVPLGVLTYAASAEAYRRRVSGIPSVPSLVWGALGIAALLAVVSRLADLTPGYVFGLVLAFTALGARALTPAQEGRAVGIGALLLALLAGAAWVARIPVHAAAGDAVHPGFWLVFGEDVLTQTFVGGVVALVFGLLPMRGLDGGLLWGWSKTAWLALYAAATFLFVLVLTDPAGVVDGTTTAMLVRTGVIFGVFFLGSLAFAAWFRLRPDPSRPTAPPPAV